MTKKASLPQSLQSASGSSRNLAGRGYNVITPSAGNDVDRVGATCPWSTETYQFNLVKKKNIKSDVQIVMLGFLSQRLTYQYGVHFHSSGLQVFAHCSDLIIGQVGCVILMQLQQTLQLIFGLITDVLVLGNKMM